MHMPGDDLVHVQTFVTVIQQNLQHKTNTVGNEGRSTSFEITMNDQLIFSKLETKGFPYAEDIIDAAQKASRGETVSKITKKQNCVVM
ncbi:migration and invasion enhancer 1-like [Acipenser oxyrinchus oxyrinchus]|uniref:Migration and invasion enhancer 1-like n=1 Tax=Acipenser oxyrinchus oxyrinchus TaxID=40147 RepID=A0AAD8FQM9_ACIOX|nr:migration and invasion enhancer 1-like [Acipenser oxyrinchus oxyrinchus]